MIKKKGRSFATALTNLLLNLAKNLGDTADGLYDILA